MFLISPEDLMRSISNFRDVLEYALIVNNQELSKVLKNLCENHQIFFNLNYMTISNARDDDITFCIYSKSHQLIIIEDDFGNLILNDSSFILKDGGNENDPHDYKIVNSSEVTLTSDELIKRFEFMFENHAFFEDTVFIVNLDSSLLDEADINLINNAPVKFHYNETGIGFIVGTKNNK